MSDEWKYRDLPRANGQVAPAKWDADIKEWVPYTTKDKIEVTNLPDNQDVSDSAVKAELESIKSTQAEILKRLDKPISTLVTGSVVEKITDVDGHIGTRWQYIGEGNSTNINQVPLNVSEYRNQSILISNNTDNNLGNVAIYSGISSNGGTFFNPSVTMDDIPSGTEVYLDDLKNKLEKEIYTHVVLRIKFSEKPEDGKVDVTFLGRK